MSDPKKNLIYNIIYQLLLLIIPLITAPYLSRVLGVEGTGIYSYTYSIAYYFMLLTLLGVNNYGNRSIAKVRDDEDKLSRTFWSIYLFQLFTGLIMILLYSLYVLLFDIPYKKIAIIELLFIVSSTFDINWFFFGLEEFKKTITRNTFIKIGNILLIFLFVKSKNDLWRYTLIMSGMTLLSQVIMWSFLRKRIRFTKVTFLDVKKHIIPNLILFIPVIAISLYKMMDKIMLGNLSNVIEVGYYENAEKLINIPTSIISALGTVMLPRISNIASRGENDKIKNYIEKSISFLMFLSFSMCFGLISVGYIFAPIFFGENFQKTGILIMLLSVTLPFVSFANVLRTQYLIPKEKDKSYIISVVLGALVNLILNGTLIPIYGSIGACIGTIFAEVTVMLYQSFSLRKELPIIRYILNVLPFFIKGFMMFICIYPINFTSINKIMNLVIQIILGVTIYFILNIKYLSKLFNLKNIGKGN